MSLYYQDANTTILHGDCIETMRGMPENSVDSIVTDPPYGLGFMGKKWDALPPGEEWARECLRVLKPGGHIIAFGGTRTWHRLAVAIEDAGFEMRDSLAWLYGSGFPKSHDISKAIDKMAGAEREVIGPRVRVDGKAPGKAAGIWSETGELPTTVTAPATSEAQQWEGWGTALKPAYEPAVMARKPFTGTVAANVLEHGTGAINIDASRINPGEAVPGGGGRKAGGSFTLDGCSSMAELEALAANGAKTPNGRDARATLQRAREYAESKPHSAGRFPANLILDEHTAELLDAQSGMSKSGKTPKSDSRGAGNSHIFASESLGRHDPENSYTDSGGASRFFYVAKAPKSERPIVDGVAHATVKPLKLMRYLVRMVTPPGGTVLDPFAGSGTTIEAALIEGYNVIGIERETDYLPLIKHRIDRASGDAK